MKDKRKVALFGATGSIGLQTIDVIDRIDGYELSVLSAGSNWQPLSELALHCKPEIVTLADESGYKDLKSALSGTGIEVVAGQDAASEAAESADYDICLNGLVGIAGLMPSYHALKRGKRLALANKESLVLAGDILNKLATEFGGEIVPVDSEHCAIHQCLKGETLSEVKRLILTASGGPFREWSLEKIKNATRAEALNHPTWKMGPKITIDSASLMNKGLEVIEAYYLFGLSAKNIDVCIHPQSIVHSFVEYVDGNIKAQLGKPDMRLPIQYALTYPQRVPTTLHDDEPSSWSSLSFEQVDEEKFPCLGLAFNALEKGGTATAVLNGADEAAVARFLDEEISFGDISVLIENALNNLDVTTPGTIQNVIDADRWGREYVKAIAI